VEKRPSRKKRPVGRPRTGARPVIAMRMHEDDYERLRKLAQDHKFTISEEAAHQIKLSFEWADTISEMKRLTGTIGGVRELMKSFGFQKIQLNLKDAIWAEPNVDTLRMSHSVDAAAIVKAMESELAALLANAIKKVMPGGNQ